MPECEIKFDNPREIFYSGEVLSGVIQFINDKKRTFNSMVVEFRGYAKVLLFTKYLNINYKSLLKIN